MLRNRTPAILILACVLLLAGMPALVHAQVRNLLPRLFKNGETTRSAFTELAAAPAKSVAQVLGDGKVTAMGVITDADGFILTKASELTGKIECRLQDGKVYEAKIVGVQPAFDLAMLKIEAKNLTPIKWAAKSKPEVGSWLASVGVDKDPIAIGVVSTPRRSIPKQPGALGIQRKIHTTEDGKEDAVKEAQIGTVYDNSAAAKAGLKVDDTITHVDGKEILTFEQLATTVREHGPGDVLRLRVKRGEDTFEVNVELSPMSVLPMMEDSRGALQNRMGGKLSTRRFGFSQVIQHDTVLKPEDCGGPVVTLDGDVVGINIARAGRVDSYALPADVIVPLLKDLKSGKLAPPKDVAKIFPIEKKDDSAQVKEEKEEPKPDKKEEPTQGEEK